MSGRSWSTRSVSVRIVRAAPASPRARCTRAEHEPHLDGDPGNGVVELWSQAVRLRQRRACVLVSPLVECDTRCRRARQRARRVVAEAGLVDDRLCRLGESCCLTPSSLFGRDERELCVCQVGLLDGAERPAPARSLR